MKTKTNQEIMVELQTRGRFKSPKEVDRYFLEALEAKDEQARQEKIELVERMPNKNSFLAKGEYYKNYFDTMMEWQAKKLTQLKDGNE